MYRTRAPASSLSIVCREADTSRTTGHWLCESRFFAVSVGPQSRPPGNSAFLRGGLLGAWWLGPCLDISTNRGVVGELRRTGTIEVLVPRVCRCRNICIHRSQNSTQHSCVGTWYRDTELDERAESSRGPKNANRSEALAISRTFTTSMHALGSRPRYPALAQQSLRNDVRGTRERAGAFSAKYGGVDRSSSACFLAPRRKLCCHGTLVLKLPRVPRASEPVLSGHFLGRRCCQRGDEMPA